MPLQCNPCCADKLEMEFGVTRAGRGSQNSNPTMDETMRIMSTGLTGRASNAYLSTRHSVANVNSLKAGRHVTIHADVDNAARKQLKSSQAAVLSVLQPPDGEAVTVRATKISKHGLIYQQRRQHIVEEPWPVMLPPRRRPARTT